MATQPADLAAMSDEQYKGYRLGQAEAIDRILAGLLVHLDPSTRVIRELHELDTAVPGTVILTSGGVVWRLPTGSGIMIGGRSLPAVVLTTPEQQDNTIAKVRAYLYEHEEYLPAAVNYDCCARCNALTGHYVPWPCDPYTRLRAALDLQEKP